MKITKLEGLHVWHEFQADRGIDFNGYFWKSSAGGVLIDPMPLTKDEIQKIQDAGGVRWILVTNAEHLRAAPALKDVFGASVLAPSQEMGRLGEGAAHIDAWFEGQSDLPGDLGECLAVYPLRGGKSPVEPALYLKPLQALYFADVVRSHVSGALRLLPDEKLADPKLVAESLRALADLPLEAVLLGDGDSIYNGAREAFGTLL